MSDHLRELFRRARRLPTTTDAKRVADTVRAVEALQAKVVAAGGPMVTGLAALEREARRRRLAP